MTDKYILDGRVPLKCNNLTEWARWFTEEDRHVANDWINGVHVSTVFLGIDHSFPCHENHGRGPILFETMIFGGVHDGWQERCSTWEQAEDMHQRACNVVRNTGLIYRIRGWISDKKRSLTHAFRLFRLRYF